jgi:putative FmdB family regulatory protein
VPVYEYECGKCGVFEQSQRISEPALTKCPTCRRKVRRLISSTSFQLKGSGWYVTDYARAGQNGKDGKDGKDGSKDGESKSESASDGGSDAKADTKSESTSDTKSNTKSSSTSTTAETKKKAGPKTPATTAS